MKQLLTLLFALAAIQSYAQETESRYERRIRAKHEKGARKQDRKDEKQQEVFDKANNVYQYPVDTATDLITYHKTIMLSPVLTKDLIFKRLKKFITLEQFNRVENIRCKDKAYVSAQLYDNAILYEDAESGEIIFNGFFPLQFVNSHHCILTFKGKLLVKDGNYSYTLSDFTVIEFLAAPKTKGKSSGSTFAYGSAAFGSSHSTSTFSDKQLRTMPLEEFMLNSEYAVSSDADFNEARKSMIKRMKEVIAGVN